jgi:hypothetical protein
MVKFDNLEFPDPENDKNNELDNYIIAKYLIKEYVACGATLKEAKKEAKKLLKENKNNIYNKDGLAYILGERSMEFFALFFLSKIFIIGDDKAPLAPIHSEIFDTITQTLNDKTKPQQLEYTLCRGIGKSTFITLVSSIWCAVYKKKRFILIASATLDTASTFIRSIKLAMEGNKKLESAFGQLYIPNKFISNTEQIELANKVMIQSMSASSTLRGKNYGTIRIELLILDDFQKEDETQTQDARDKKWKKYSDDVKYAIQKGNSTLLAVGTIQNDDDFYARLSKLPTWIYRKAKGVLVPDVDELFESGLWGEFRTLLFNKKDKFRLETAKEFYFSHEKEMQYPLLWQDFWDCLTLSLEYYENPVSFKQEIQGMASASEEKRFKTIITESPEEIESHNFKLTCLTIDPATTTTKRADYSAFVVGSTSNDTNIIYIRKGEILKLMFDDYIKHTIDLLKKFIDISHIIIEKNCYAGVDVTRLKEKIQLIPELKNREFTWINDPQRDNKYTKIETIVGDCNFGRIIFNESDEDAINQLKDYQGSSTIHDDFADCVAEMVKKIKDIKVVRKVKFFGSR